MFEESDEKRELARLKRRARETLKKIAWIISELAYPAFDLGLADGKMAAMLNQPYKPPDIIKADRRTEHEYWRGWRDGREAAIEEGYKPTTRLPKPPIPDSPDDEE